VFLSNWSRSLVSGEALHGDIAPFARSDLEALVVLGVAPVEVGGLEESHAPHETRETPRG
jgi:hypothetical protein